MDMVRTLSALKKKQPPRKRKTVFEELEAPPLTREEKQSLITKHAKRWSRLTEPHPILIGTVIALCLFIIGFGWVISFGRGYWLTPINADDQALTAIKQTANALKDEVKTFEQLKELTPPTSTNYGN